MMDEDTLNELFETLDQWEEQLKNSNFYKEQKSEIAKPDDTQTHSNQKTAINQSDNR
ncbi:MAG: hypothetical protein AAF224_01835 [Pseudomonadota bacterium]